MSHEAPLSRLFRALSEDEVDYLEGEGLSALRGTWMQDLVRESLSHPLTEEEKLTPPGMSPPFNTRCRHCGAPWSNPTYLRHWKVRHAPPNTLPCCKGIKPKGSKK